MQSHKITQLFYSGLLAAGWLFGFMPRLHGQEATIRALQAQLPAIKDSLRYVDALNRLGALYHSRQMDTSFLYVDKAMEIAGRHRYTAGEAAAARNLGNHYALRANSYLSYRFYLDALRRYRVLNDSAGISQVYMNIGIYYQYEGQHRQAVQYIQDALRIARRLNNDTALAHILANCYFVYATDTLRPDSARIALQAARALAGKCRDERLLLYTGLFQANELLRSNAAAAESMVDSLVRAARALGHTYLALYGNLQQYGYKSYRQAADTIACRREAVSLALQGGYRELVLPTVMQLYTYYSRRKMNDSAAWYSGVMLDILEAQQASKQQGELDYIAYFRQDQQLRQLQLQHDYQQQLLHRKGLEAGRRRFIILFLVALLLLATLLLLDVNRAYRRSSRNAASLREKNREITEKNTLLNTHDDFKNKLISLIAHDFRSPLINIMGITGFLKDQSLSLEEAAALMQRIENSSRHTLHVFDNILRWIRTQLSGFAYAPQPCAPAAMITEALQSLQDSCDEKSLQVKVDIPAEWEVYADREMLQFVHRNLLHNAIKFSPEGGLITVTAGEVAGQVTVRITDEGRGIPPAMLPHLFEYSSNRPRTGANGGAGLALIICRDFMGKMNGRIQAVNNTGGKGSTFSYVLPAVKSYNQ